jgi:hypothetical protein
MHVEDSLLFSCATVVVRAVKAKRVKGVIIILLYALSGEPLHRFSRNSPGLRWIR